MNWLALAQIEEAASSLLESLDNPVVAALAGMILTVLILTLIYKIVGSDSDDNDNMKALMTLFAPVITEVVQTQKEIKQNQTQLTQILREQAEANRLTAERFKEHNEITMELIKEGQKQALRIVTHIDQRHDETQRQMKSITDHLASLETLATEIPAKAAEEVRKEAEEIRKSLEALILKAYTMKNEGAGENITDTSKPTLDPMATPGKRLKPAPASKEPPAAKVGEATQEGKPRGTEVDN